MTKWDYIHQISKNGSRYGEDGGVLDLLNWSGKINTEQVTGEEAKMFWELYHKERCRVINSERVSENRRCSNE